MTRFPLPQTVWRFAAPAGFCSLLSLFSSPISVAADPATETELRALHEKVLARDQIIADLQARVSELEQHVNNGKPRPAKAKKPAVAQAPPASTPISPPPARATTAATPGPGAFDVDALAAERALERTLTAEGALLLPAKSFEIEPYFTYKRSVSDSPTLAQEGNAILARSFEVRRNEFDIGLRGRFGLPYDAQIELDIPYRSVDQSVLIPTGLSAFDEQSRTGSSLGDVKVGVAKTLLRESDWRPDLVGRLTWDTDTGDTIDNDVALGIGFNEARVSLTALKRQDPIAFTASLAYSTAFEKNGVEPGDEVSLLLGASLAASPGTSLSVALAQTFSSETRIDGQKVTGSDQVSSSLLIGASSILGRQTLFSLTGAVGLTDDAPDYGVNLSLPIRF